MNIFALHPSARVCAQWHCDKHVIKMILEHCQLMYTAIHVLAPHLLDHVAHLNQLAPYKKTHMNHPSAKWVRESRQNFLWLLLLTVYLCKEKKYRWGGEHRCERHLRGLFWVAQELPFPQHALTPWAIANPYKDMEPLEAYRKYYREDKKHLHKWSKRDVPEFMSQ